MKPGLFSRYKVYRVAVSTPRQPRCQADTPVMYVTSRDLVLTAATAYTGAMTTTQHPEKGSTMTRTRKTTEVTIPTVTDEQYLDLLAIRLGAMKGFAATPQTVDEETKNKARAAVRNARKVRKNEAAILVAYRQHLDAQAQARSDAAKKAASTRRSRKSTKPTAEVTTPATGGESEQDTPTESVAA